MDTVNKTHGIAATVVVVAVSRFYFCLGAATCRWCFHFGGAFNARLRANIELSG